MTDVEVKHMIPDRRTMLRSLAGGAATLCLPGRPRAAQASAPVPEIDGDWWQVAGNPDMGAISAPRQQPVDFGIWQAADGSWQIWSCVRNTKAGGKTRIFHRWEGKRLTDTNWTPMGVPFHAEPAF